jgi:hypothetical protein
MSIKLLQKAKNLIKMHSYPWDPKISGYVRPRRIGEETVEEFQSDKSIITFEELCDQKLYQTELTTDEKADALNWLRRRIETN